MQTPQIILNAIEKVFTKILSYDKDTKDKLLELNDKTIKIEFKGIPHISFFMIFSKNSFILSNQYMADIDASLTIKPSAIFDPNKNVFLEGDTVIIQQLVSILKQISIDWESLLANFTGDIIAYKIISILKNIYMKSKNFTGVWSQYINEYLQDEIRILVSIDEYKVFSSAVDDLMLRVERLTKKINNTSKKII